MGLGETTFGPFVLDRAHLTLQRDGKSLPIGQRGFALLAALAAHDDVVSKTDLVEAGWPGTIVEEGNLTVQIAALRKALGPRDDGQEWIVTVPRVGYRLLRGEESRPAPWPIPALAVLPFDALGDDRTLVQFGDGVVGDIITALSRFRTLAVISRQSSFAYRGQAIDVRQVAQELGATYVLEGSVRSSGARLRVSAQLVDGDSGAQLWARNFDGTLDDVFDMQDRITAAVTTLIEPRIRLEECARSRRERPDSKAPYDLYLRATEQMGLETPEGNLEATELIEAAIQQDPRRGTLLAAAAWIHEHRINMGWPSIGPDDRERCVAFARRGLDYAGGDPRSMTHCAMALTIAGRDDAMAMSILEAAYEANPNDIVVAAARGIGELHLGKVDAAHAIFLRALAVAPAEGEVRFVLTALAHVHMIKGAYEEALGFATRSLTVNRHFDATYWMLIAGNAHLGRMSEAHEYIRQLRELVPDAAIRRIREGQHDRHPDRMANILEGLRRAGMPEESP